MDVHVSLAGPGDRATRIYRELLDAILDGRLRPGERLPPTRELATRLAVARNTVAVAYERLTAEGFVVARVGAGTWVTRAATVHARARPRRAAADGIQPRSLWTSIPIMATGAPAPAYDFRVGLPDADLFPLATWRRLVVGELRAATLRPATYRDPAGHEGLRAAIARYAGVARSVRAGPDDVLVTNGAQQALDLIGRVLVGPGDRVAVEEPGYPPARDLFRSLGARVTGVPVDAEGLDVAALPPDTRLVYVTPSHQFPLGTAMSLARRRALLDWAARRDAVVVEDDYDSEFRFSDRPLEPVQSLDRAGRVVYVGTFSKTLLPTLRLGYLVAPASLRDALRAARQLTDWHGDHTGQGALARFIDSGELARHVRKATRVYAERHAVIRSTLEEDFVGLLTLVPSAAGLHICALADPNAAVDIGRWVDRARVAGVAVESMARYGGWPGLVLGYGAIGAADIPAGLRLLRRYVR